MSTANGHSPKPFDCVAVKEQIQEQLARAQAGKTRETLNADARQRIAADPHLKRLLELVAPAPPPARKAS